jgi:hypothetical protein
MDREISNALNVPGASLPTVKILASPWRILSCYHITDQSFAFLARVFLFVIMQLNFGIYLEFGHLEPAICGLLRYGIKSSMMNGRAKQ